MNRGTAPADAKAGVSVPFASFKGDVRFYRGTRDSVGVGDLLGWAVVAEVTAGTLVRCAMNDAEVGQITGSNTPTAQPLTGTVDLAHDHGGLTDTQDNTDPTKSRTVSQAAANTTVSHLDHPHTVFSDLANATPLTIAPITFDPISPQAISFFLIEFIGVST